MSGTKVFFSFEKNKNTLIGLIMTEEMLTGLTMISVHCQTETVTRLCKKNLGVCFAILFHLMSQKIRYRNLA